MKLLVLKFCLRPRPRPPRLSLSVVMDRGVEQAVLAGDDDDAHVRLPFCAWRGSARQHFGQFFGPPDLRGSNKYQINDHCPKGRKISRGLSE